MTMMSMQSRYRRRPLLLLLTALLLILACIAPGAGAASKRELLIGIEPEHNIFDQMQRYRVLAGYLSDELGLSIRLTIMSRYGEIEKRFRTLRLDGAMLSSYTAMLATREFGFTPVVNIVNPDDDFSSRGYIFTRADSGIENVGDMEGKSVVFVDRATTEGYIFALSWLRKHGITDLDSYFSRSYFSGSHASVVFAVLDGRADVGAVKNTVFAQLVSKDPYISSELRVIDKSPLVPEVTLCIKSDLEPGLIEKLQTALLKMDQTVEGNKVLKKLQIRRFVPASPESFDVVSQLAEAAGMQGAGNR